MVVSIHFTISVHIIAIQVTIYNNRAICAEIARLFTEAPSDKHFAVALFVVENRKRELVGKSIGTVKIFLTNPTEKPSSFEQTVIIPAAMAAKEVWISFQSLFVHLYQVIMSYASFYSLIQVASADLKCFIDFKLR